MDQMKSKSFLTSNIITLYREVNGRVRYYKIKTYLTLFGEYLLIREWGGVDNKKATGQKQSYFTNMNEAIEATKEIILTKQRKGYISSSTT